MNEEKFTNLLRESMELERQLPFQEEGWQTLQERLETDQTPKQRHNRWWLLLLLLGFGGLYMLQWQQLKDTQKDLEELRQKQLDLTIKTDTVFKEIFIQKYDTIYKTIIKEIPLYKEKQVPKKLKNKKQINDLSFLTPSKTPELIHKNTEAISLYTKEIPVKKQKITHSQQLKPSIVYQQAINREIYPLDLGTPAWSDFFLQIGLAIHGEAAQQEQFFQMPHLDKLDGFKMDNLPDMQYLKNPTLTKGFHNMNPFFSAATFSAAMPSELPNLGETVLTNWRSRRHQMLTQIDIVFALPNKRLQPMLNFSAASNWQRQTMILNSSYQDWNDSSWIDATGLAQLDDIPSISFRTNAPSVIGADATPKTEPVHIQASFYSAFELWYELNVGLQYKF